MRLTTLCRRCSAFCIPGGPISRSIQLLHLEQARIPLYRRAAPWVGWGVWYVHIRVEPNQVVPHSSCYMKPDRYLSNHESEQLSDCSLGKLQRRLEVHGSLEPPR